MSSTMSQTSTEPTPPSRRGLKWFLGAVFLLILVVAALGAVAWFGLRSTDTVSDSFEGTVERVVIDVAGRVEIQAGDTTAVTAERQWFVSGPPDVDMTLESGVLRIESDCATFRFWCLVHVTATVPAGAEVVVDTDAGGISVAGISGGVDLTTSAGGIAVDVGGPAVLRSSAGGISGTVRDGDVDAETSAGGIDLTLVGDFQSLSAVTSAGSVVLTVPDGVYDVDADTSAGDVTVDVATDPDSDRTIRARSSAGSVTVREG